MERLLRLSVVVVLVAAVMVMGASESFSACSKCSKKDMGGGGIPAPLVKLHRGFCNVVFCWTEIPKEVQAKSMQPERPYIIRTLNSRTISTVDSMVAGTLLGTCKSLTRAAGGVSEAVLFLIPPYRPMMDPATPLPVRMHPSTRAIYTECRGCGPFMPGTLPCMPGMGMAMKGCCAKMMAPGACPKMRMGMGMKGGACPR